jgi:hypothetical protein
MNSSVGISTTVFLAVVSDQRKMRLLDVGLAMMTKLGFSLMAFA